MLQDVRIEPISRGAAQQICSLQLAGEARSARLHPAVVLAAEVLVQVTRDDQGRLDKALPQTQPFATLFWHDPAELVPPLRRTVDVRPDVTVPRQHRAIDDDVAGITTVQSSRNTTPRIGRREPLDQPERRPQRRPPTTPGVECRWLSGLLGGSQKGRDRRASE